MNAVTVARTRAELSAALATARAEGQRIGLVPTMGALHSGHASLVDVVRAAGADVVVLSIFVNPLQFAPGEDLDRYPRTFDSDLALAQAHGVNVVFAPTPDQLYPAGVSAGASADAVTVEPGPLGAILEGAIRPTHFRGVLTVVSKLFGLVQPDLAVFGEKDYQQLTLLRLMARDLCLPVQIIGAPTVREDDGLALSSRNRYLNPDERALAATLSSALAAAAASAWQGAETALNAARGVLSAERAIEVDYLELTSPDLGPAPRSGAARLLVAARIGNTRLIDNTGLELAMPTGDHNPRSS